MIWKLYVLVCLKTMFPSLILIAILLCSIIISSNRAQFPPNFEFGVSTSAYQIEGAWNTSGKGENVWDRFTHTTFKIPYNNTGDIACDSYNLYQEDIKLLQQLGVNFYRFSLSWSRILPNGFANKINPDGLRYYNDLINALVLNGIHPMVTLYHWDLPQPLQDFGGWFNSDLAVHFEDYARVAFEHFGDRVKNWVTVNEPSFICAKYGNGGARPEDEAPGLGAYLCAKNILIAHAKVYHLYNTSFREKQYGKIGISIPVDWSEPAFNSPENIEATRRKMAMTLGWWIDPLTFGDYPEIMKSRISEMSRIQNFPRSRLPEFSAEESNNLKGTYDFIGINHYITTNVTNLNNIDTSSPSYNNDLGINDVTIDQIGLGKLLVYVKETYNNPLVYITENGLRTKNSDLQDQERINYIKDCLSVVLEAITKNNCKVTKYTFWSLLDNFEWEDGYTFKFGLFNVDFNDPKRKRTPRASAAYYTSVIKSRMLNTSQSNLS